MLPSVTRLFPWPLPPLSLLLLLHLLACGVDSFCVMRQDCSPGTPGCYPRATSAAERPPFPLNTSASGVPAACPQYTSSGCCTDAANSQLFLSFLLEENTLGEPSVGGCPACSANVQALWCAFACSPNQSDYVAVQGLQNVSGVGTVLAVSMDVGSAYADGVFGSCSGVGLVRTNPLMDSTPLFLGYMGKQGVSTANTLVTFQQDSSPNSTALSMPTYNCCNFPANLTDPSATGNASCPCASCLGNCPSGLCAAGVPAFLTPGLPLG
jgi:hypothetical protein